MDRGITTGIAGVAGIKGIAGIAGIAGIKGIAGGAGITGIKGIAEILGILGIVGVIGLLGFAVWKLHRMRQEVCTFANQVEQAVDDLISGKEFREPEEATKESLWGKCGEKFGRLYQIQEQKDEAALAEKKELKGLISDISHQTKTPLANIRLYLEFLQEEPLSKQGEQFLNKLEGQTEKMDFLLQSMVKMSRLENGIIQIQSRSEDLYRTLAAAVEEIVPAAAKKEIALSVDCEETVRVRHDAKWTEEAIFNVLDNAVKYTDCGGKIHIFVVQQEIFTKISIKDTGKGIRPERQAEIFTRFYREPEVHEQSGIGIGLYLTRRILELQNGYIEVRSEAGEGSEFCLYLPNESINESITNQ